LTLFESNRRQHYSERGIRRMFARYSELADLELSVSSHKLRHFLVL
jgi:integrase/recombinase XerD